MSSSCLTDDIPCPQCGHPARLSVESNCCHDWSEVHCPFCGYSAEVDYDDPDQAEKTEKPGFGAQTTATPYLEGSWTSVSEIHSAEDFREVLAEFPSELNEEHLWVRLTRWNSETKTVEIVNELIKPDFTVAENMRLEYSLPADHEVWWNKERTEVAI